MTSVPPGAVCALCSAPDPTASLRFHHPRRGETVRLRLALCEACGSRMEKHLKRAIPKRLMEFSAAEEPEPDPEAAAVVPDDVGAPVGALGADAPPPPDRPAAAERLGEERLREVERKVRPAAADPADALRRAAEVLSTVPEMAREIRALRARLGERDDGSPAGDPPR